MMCFQSVIGAQSFVISVDHTVLDRTLVLLITSRAALSQSFLERHRLSIEVDSRDCRFDAVNSGTAKCSEQATKCMIHNNTVAFGHVCKSRNGSLVHLNDANRCLPVVRMYAKIKK